MSWNKCVWACVLATLILGCSRQPPPVRVQATPAMEKAKATLQDLAKTGEVGSGLDEVRTALEELKKTDPGKADPLLKEVEALMAKPGVSEEAKTKAKEILEKL